MSYAKNNKSVLPYISQILTYTDRKVHASDDFGGVFGFHNDSRTLLVSGGQLGAEWPVTVRTVPPNVPHTFIFIVCTNIYVAQQAVTIISA